MSDISDLEASISEQALKSSSTTADGISVTRRSLKELTDFADRQRNINAAASPAALFRGMNTTLVPPGAQ